MATIIQIKRSSGNTAPSTSVLAEGELAYSEDRSNDGAGAILYIESVASDGSTAVIDAVGGKKYTATVDNFLTNAGPSVGSQVVLAEAGNNGSNTVSLKAPDALAGDITYTLPATTTDGYFLQTDASGNLTWAVPGTGALDIHGTAAKNSLASADEFLIWDSVSETNKKVTAENLGKFVFSGISGDITVDSMGVATISADAVALGTDTTGDYVSGVSGTANQISVSGSGGETAAVTVSLTDDVVLVGDLTVGGNDIKMAGGTTALTFSGSGDVAVAGALQVSGNDIKSSTGTALTLSGADVEVKGDLQVSGNDVKMSGGTTALTFSGSGDVTVAAALQVSGNDIKSSTGTAITLTGTDAEIKGDLQVTGNDIKMSGGTTALTFSGSGDVAVAGDLKVSGNDIKSSSATALTLSGADVTVAGDLTVSGNDIKMLGGTTALTFSGSGDVTVAGDLQVSGDVIKASNGQSAFTLDGANVTVGGNLTVNGTTTTVNSTTVTVADSLLKLANGNEDNIVDSGFYAEYVSGMTTKWAGLFKDHADDKFRLFKDLEVDPTSNVVDQMGAGYTIGTLVANITGGTVSNLSSAISVVDGGTGATSFTANGVLFGNGVNAIQSTAQGTDGYFLYSNAGTPDWTNTVDGGTY